MHPEWSEPFRKCKNSTENILQKNKNFYSEDVYTKNSEFMGFDEAHKEALFLFLCDHFPRDGGQNEQNITRKLSIENTISEIIPVYTPRFSEPIGFWYFFKN